MAILARNPFSNTVNTVANTAAVVYTAPSTVTYSIVTLFTLNTNTANASVTIGISVDTTLDAVDYIQYNEVLAPSQGIQRTQLILKPGESIIVLSDSGNVNVRASGVEYQANNIVVDTNSVILSTASTNLIHTAPTNGIVELSDVNIVNYSTGAVDVSLAVTAASAPSLAAGHYVEYNRTIAASGLEILTCGIVVPGENVFMETNTDAAISVRIASIVVTG